MLHARRRGAGRVHGCAVPDQHPANARARRSGRRRAGRDDGHAGAEAAGDDAGSRRLPAADRRTRRPGGGAERRGAPHARRRERMEQGHPPPSRRDARRAGRATRLHGDAPAHQGAALFVDGVRLPSQAGHHRQHRETAAERRRQGHRRTAVGNGQHALSSVPRGRRRALEGVPRPARAAEPQAGPFRDDERHGRGRRCGRLAAKEVPDGVRRRPAAHHPHEPLRRSGRQRPGRGARR